MAFVVDMEADTGGTYAPGSDDVFGKTLQGKNEMMVFLNSGLILSVMKKFVVVERRTRTCIMDHTTFDTDVVLLTIRVTMNGVHNTINVTVIANRRFIILIFFAFDLRNCGIAIAEL